MTAKESMIVKRVEPVYSHIREVKQLMKDAFPQREQMPWILLVLMSLRKCVHFLAFEDQGKLIGFTYAVEGRSTVFILFLAVNGQIRSKGYGSRILTYLKETFQGKDIALNIEPVLHDAPNYEQRKKRLEFYRRNGFHETGYLLRDGKDEADAYSVLSTTKLFSRERYREAIGKLSFGVAIPEVEKES